MPATRISTVAAIAALNAITALYNAGGAGSIKIYTGAAPTELEIAATGTLLGTLPLSATAFPTAVDGTNKATATANAITADSVADANGTAGYFRACNNAGVAVSQGTVTATAGGGDMEIDNIAVQAGDTITVTAWVLNMPEL